MISLVFSLQIEISPNFCSISLVNRYSKMGIILLIFKVGYLSGFFMDFQNFWCSGKRKFSSLYQVLCLFMKYSAMCPFRSRSVFFPSDFLIYCGFGTWVEISTDLQLFSNELQLCTADQQLYKSNLQLTEIHEVVPLSPHSVWKKKAKWLVSLTVAVGSPAS